MPVIFFQFNVKIILILPTYLRSALRLKLNNLSSVKRVILINLFAPDYET